MDAPDGRRVDDAVGFDGFDLAVGLSLPALNMNLAILQGLGSFPEEWRVTLRPGAALDVWLDPPEVSVIEGARLPEEVGRVLFTLTLAEGTFTADGVEIPVEDWGLTFPLDLAYADLVAAFERAGREVPPFLRERLTRFPPERFSLQAMLLDFTNAHLIVEEASIRFGNACELTPEQMAVFKEALVKLLETLRLRPDAHLLGLTAQPGAQVGALWAQRWLIPTGGAVTAYQSYWGGPKVPTLATLITTRGQRVPTLTEAPRAYGYGCRVLGQRLDAQGSLLISQRALCGYLFDQLIPPLQLAGATFHDEGLAYAWTAPRSFGGTVRLTLRPVEGAGAEAGTVDLDLGWRYQHQHPIELPGGKVVDVYELDFRGGGTVTVRFTGAPQEGGTSARLGFRFAAGASVPAYTRRSDGYQGIMEPEVLRRSSDLSWLLAYVRDNMHLVGPGAEAAIAWISGTGQLYRPWAAANAELEAIDRLPPLLMSVQVMLPGAKTSTYKDLRFERSIGGTHLVMGLSMVM
ncbi:MAG: hypothetical protein H6739_35290 [Alphaproteobacteria bacterium]|nr:hypothetical protein [Alphaproteobacteria bacterium]